MSAEQRCVEAVEAIVYQAASDAGLTGEQAYEIASAAYFDRDLQCPHCGITGTDAVCMAGHEATCSVNPERD